ncbi:MAG: hypothetical protein R3F17_05035 [Planctomycetota bacterium]
MKRSQRLIALLLLPAIRLRRSNLPNEKGEMTDSEKVGLSISSAPLRYAEMREPRLLPGPGAARLEIDPDNERLLLMLGRCYQTRGTLPDVLAAEKIFRDHPAKNDYRVHLGLGGAMERKGSFYDQAARNIESGETYTEAADPTARVAELRTNAQTAWVQAIESYKPARTVPRLVRGPQRPDAHHRLGWALPASNGRRNCCSRSANPTTSTSSASARWSPARSPRRRSRRPCSRTSRSKSMCASTAPSCCIAARTWSPP